MKLTKKLEAEILEVYKTYWDAFLKGDIRSIASLVDDNCHVIGSSVGEVFNDKRSLLKYLKATIGQIKEKAELRSRKISVTAEGKDIMVNDQSDLYILIDDTWTFYGHGRASTLFSKKANKWKIIHLHRSLPDYKAEEGEQVATEKIKAENLQLRDAVKRRTVELEYKNRELEIESAVERVRAKALAMHKSEEISKVVNTLRNELEGLNIPGVAAATITLQQENGNIRLWDITSVVELADGFHFSMDIIFNLKETKPTDWIRRIWDGTGKYFVYKQDKKNFKRTLEWTSKYNAEFAGNARQFIETNKIKNTWHPVVPLSHGKLSLDLLQEPVAEVESILTKMGAAFDLAYKRFLDLKNAEAQTRESQIQLALERVRARTMAMQKSDELQDAAILLFQQIRSLGVQTGSCGFNIWNKKEKTATVWMSSAEGGLQAPFDMPLSVSPIYKPVDAAMKKGDEFLVEEVEGKNLVKHFDYLLTLPGIGDTIKHLRKTGYVFPKRMIYHFAFFNNGYLSFHTHEPYPEAHDIFKRFAKVFEQTYTRFLDLQKAEAQAREAQIQLALERVRARTMAMQQSDELSDVVKLLYREFDNLKLSNESTDIEIGLIDEETGIASVWAHLYLSDGTISTFKIPLAHFEGTRDEYKQWRNTPVEKRNEIFITTEFSGKRWDKILKNAGKFPELAEFFKSLVEANISKWVTHNAYFSHGLLTLQGTEIYSPETQEIQKRFAKVFEQTYTRFLDLQKAEAQAREAQIELSLERVRARTMAMHKSDELVDTSVVLFQELKTLGVKAIRTGVAIIDDATEKMELWSSQLIEQKQNKVLGVVPMRVHPFFTNLLHAWKRKDQNFSFEMQGDEVKDYYLTMSSFLSYPQQKTYNLREIFNPFFFSEGSLTVVSSEPLSDEERSIMQRFARVFGLLYRRFLDLQKAEAQAREAQIELGLERVRARAMAMQKSDELSELVDTVFKELTKLDFALTWCIINIIDEPSLSNTVWAANPDITKAPESYHMLFEDYPFHHAMMKGWKERNTKSVYILEGDEKRIYDDYLFSETEFKRTPEAAQAASRAMEKYVVSFSFSNFGGLQTVGDVPLSDANLDILSRFGKVFDLTYTRFNDLKQAEAQARESQIEAALERVRSRSLAMHKSDELIEMINVVHEQLKQLNFNLDTAMFSLNYKEKPFNLLMAVPGQEYLTEIIVPRADIAIMNRILDVIKSGAGSFAATFSKEEKDQWIYLALEYTIIKHASAERKKMLQDANGISVSISLLKHISLIIGNYACIPYTKEENDIFRRFAVVFEQSYTRFLDLQKAEAQAREAEIQLALERVRARSLAMHHTSELQEVVDIVAQQLHNIDMDINGGVVLTINDEVDADLPLWASSGAADYVQKVVVPFFDRPIFIHLRDAIKRGNNFFTEEYSKKEKDEMFHHLFRYTPWSSSPEERKEELLSREGGLARSAAISQHTSIAVTNHNGKKFSDEDHEILKRFGNVFEQTYTRFLDLQKAEAQAKESQIQLALERVRARTMAMQHSDELKDAAALLFQQVKSLGVPAYSCGYNIWEKNDKEFTSWMSTQDGSDFNAVHNIPLTEDANFIRFAESREKGEQFFVLELRGERMQEHYEYLKTIPAFKAYFDYAISVGFDLPETQIHHLANFSQGNLLFITLEPCPEFHDVFKRFAAVFDQTYTRFLDLQKAEEQARESQIQLAMERVRARTMAMQKSDELPEAANLLFQQVQTLGMPAWSAGYCIWDDDKRAITLSMSSEGVLQPTLRMPLTEDPSLKHFREAYERGETFFVEEVGGEALKEHYTYLRTLPGVKETLDDIEKAGFPVPTFQIFHLAYFTQGFLLFITYEPVPESHDIFKRFAKVFEQTYTRFLDLQKSEAQAREAQIQLAMERVRARTMAMQRSEELADAAQLLFQQVKELGVHPWTSGFQLWDEDRKAVTVWTSTEGVLLPPFKIATTEDPLMIHIADAAQKGETLYVEEMGGEALADHYKYMFSLPSLQEVFGKVAVEGHAPPTFQVNHAAYFSNGYLLFITHEPCPEAHDIFKRFAKVFEQTYTRFLDLQKSEAQSRESQIQLALERVRARTMAMQKSDELPETSFLLFQQVKELGETTVQNSIGIVNEEAGFVELSTTVRGHNLPHTLNVPIDDPYVMAKAVAAWKAKRRSLKLEFAGQELINYNEHRNSFFETKVNFPEDQWIVNIIFFSKGWLSFSSDKDISDETFELLKRFAAVFEQTYTRFNDLKQAEAQAREAKTEAALEKVRSRTMAMQKGEELNEVAVLLYKELIALGVTNFVTCGYVEINEKINRQFTWVTGPGGDSLGLFYLPLTGDATFDERYAAWKQQQIIFQQTVAGEVRSKHLEYAITTFNSKEAEEMVRNQFPDPTVFYCFNFSHGYLHLVTGSELKNEEEILLARFTRVFEQTYARFLDLKKAETQAREAQIEAALERVRSRTMGMQKSEELKEVIQVVYEQFVHLNIHVEHTGFIMDYKERNDMHIWLADKHAVPFQVSIPYFDCAHWNSFNEAKEKGKDFFANKLSFEEKNKFYQDLFKLIPGLPEETLEYYFSCPGLAISTVLLDNIGLYIENFSGTPYTDEENKTLMRFGKVFQQTYTRFLDLQKAEAQAREAQIETALEKVRSRSLSMHTANELGEVVKVIVEKLQDLSVVLDANGVVLCTYFPDSKNVLHWIVSPDFSMAGSYLLPYFDHPIFNAAWNSKIAGDEYFSKAFNIEEKNSFFEYAFEHSDYKFFPEEFKQWVFQNDKHSLSFAWQKNSAILIPSHTGVLPTEADKAILIRFSKVFEQAYVRFLDLQKAEAQAREAKIETALEKVRASTMAMQHSDHLSETAFVLFKQFKELGEAPERIFIATFDEEQQGIIDIWGTNQGGNQLNKLFKVSADEPTVISKIITAWKEKKRSVIIDLKGEELKQYISFLKSTGIPVVEGIMEERRVQTIGCFSKGVIGVTTPEPQSAESVQLLERFAGVFDLTYTRFLDLQQAEAQAREAKIEAALERVRSRTMGMQKSDELGAVSHVLNEQLQQLNFKNYIAGFLMDYKNSDDFEVWRSDPSQLLLNKTRIPYFDHPLFTEFVRAKEKSLDFNTLCLSFEEKNKWVDHALPYFPPLPGEIKDLLYNGAGYAISCAYMKNVAVFIENFDGIPFTDEENAILKRFAKVFEQTYTRFLDLQKAEAQAREAKIEAALEKVRSRTMAMQTSAELTDVAGLLFEQVSALGIKTWTAGFNVWSEDNNSYVDYITSPQGGFIAPYTVYTETAEALTDISNARKSGVEFDVQYVEGEKIKQLYLALTKLDEKQYEIMLQDGVRFPSHQYEHFVFGSKVSLMFITYEPVPEAHDIFKRLGKVFEQTYTRFLDLQKAEAQAREAIKQASVDRIRAEIASMRTTNDLERIQPLIWNELTTLGVPFTRCGVFIMDEEHEQVDTFLSTPEGKSIASFTSNYSDVAVISEALPYWRKKEIYKAHWDEATFLAQAQTLLSRGNITSTETYLTEHRPKDLYLHFLPFLQGILYVGNETPLKEDELQLVQNLADAFSIAYARYEDFNKLELAKEQIENTLTNLKQAQAQLVQSEKMASLGELTAGIAHEIQNPLNFVNNFSEVNKELLAELNEEIEKGNLDEVKALAKDVSDNEEKINHHGKRADAIVKGMLQHSRSSSGVKEPSDINVLADEYLRLAYHGLRAKDKSFNATMKTDFDETIGKINIVPQDVGRSVLNLITNAFYAVSEKKKSSFAEASEDKYEPTVTVTTKKINGKVEIRVADNGNGIPQKVLDKIFQPFFTTKPTGQGTGLGLSLSYDIIKAHGGEINVETREGEGSEFNIQLPTG